MAAVAGYLKRSRLPRKLGTLRQVRGLRKSALKGGGRLNELYGTGVQNVKRPRGQVNDPGCPGHRGQLAGTSRCMTQVPDELGSYDIKAPCQGGTGLARAARSHCPHDVR